MNKMIFLKSLIKKNIKLYLLLKKQRIKFSYKNKDFITLINDIR